MEEEECWVRQKPEREIQKKMESCLIWVVLAVSVSCVIMESYYLLFFSNTSCSHIILKQSFLYIFSHLLRRSRAYNVSTDCMFQQMQAAVPYLIMFLLALLR